MDTPWDTSRAARDGDTSGWTPGFRGSRADPAPWYRPISASSEGGEPSVEVGGVAPLEEVLFGPSRVADGTTNIVGALRRAMATSGYTELKEFQRVEVVVAPYQRS